MNKQLIIARLPLTFFLPHSSYFYEILQVYLHLDNNQKFSKKKLVKNILETCIARAISIAALLIALGKFFSSWIRNKKDNKTQHASKTGHTAKRVATKLRKKPAEQDQSLQPMKTYEGSLNNNNLKSNIIKKKFKVTQKMRYHIFSKNHINKEILDLGKNRDNIIEKFTNIVKLADHKSLLKNGLNQTHTIIKNHRVIVRFFIGEGEILMLNGFIEVNANNIGNIVNLLVDEDEDHCG